VYDTCTIKAPVLSFRNFWSFGESISYDDSVPAVGSNPTLTHGFLPLS